MSKTSSKLTANQPPFPANEWWMEVTRTVGVSECADIFSVDQRTIYRWRADGMTSERSASAMEKMWRLLGLLVLFDRSDLAVDAIDYLRSVVDSVEMSGVVPLAKTVHEEVNRDFLSVSKMGGAIARNEPVAVVRSWADAAKEEIDRTVAKYEKEAGRDH